MRANVFWNMEGAAYASPSFARMAGSYRAPSVQAVASYPPVPGLSLIHI